MASLAHLCSCFTPIASSGNRTDTFVYKGTSLSRSPAKFHILRAKDAKKSDGGSIKPKSMICADCNGNGAVMCSQCKGSGVNAEDLFNGQFKAGDSCWLCGGRKEMLCGSCNGAGFLGGFISTGEQ